MGRRKCLNLEQSGADVVAMCDVSCLTHINGLLGKQGQRIRAVHIAEILNSQVDVVETPEELPRDEAPASVSKPPAAGGQPRRWQDVR